MMICILLLGAVLLCMFAIPFIIACIPFLKFALVAAFLLVAYVVGIGRISGWLERADAAIKAACPPSTIPVYVPPPHPVTHRTPWRISRAEARARGYIAPAPPTDLETL